MNKKIFSLITIFASAILFAAPKTPMQSALNKVDQGGEWLYAGSQMKDFLKFVNEEPKEKNAELQTYGELMPLNLNQKIDIRFVPYGKWNVGFDKFVTILKCTALGNIFAAEANNTTLLTIGSYDDCKECVKLYKIQTGNRTE